MKKERFYSLDVFRGATVALMILVNNPGSWDHIYPPLDHAAWHGCTPTDLVFPFFLFAIGNAMAFVMPRLREAGNGAFFKKTIKRSILIFLIGLFLNWSPFIKYDDAGHFVFKVWENIRIMGVLQRTAVAYLVASFIAYFCKPKVAMGICVFILLFYWWLCVQFGAADPFSIQGWFGTNVDKSILGETHMYHGEGLAFDPEGLASGLTPIVQIVFGYFVGNYIQKLGKTYEMLTHLFVAAAFTILVAIIWNNWFPFNKKIWTSSYVVYTTGLAIMIIAVIIYFIEFKGHKSWLTKFFDVFGKNPLFIFCLSGFLPRVLWLVRWSIGTNPEGKPLYENPLSWLYHHLCQPVFADERNGSLMYAIINIIFYWSIVYILDKKKIYIKV
ncbi:acyltransferase family protein [Rhizosphaericola mali]|uniref:DUF5009 domain-containing protein n=1 Tax=Rhizosphaericola mali TaxID=2545455 RepID=A0A5P2G1R8_9BACT|nr:DUF5009 domain-containing protein [Rhizosphaericola mali]QES87782.1 DUF5009 domain-containing protein [Rhizosphaericola mali]